MMFGNMVVFKVTDPKNALECDLLFLCKNTGGRKKYWKEALFFFGYIFIMADLSRNLFLVLLERRLPFLKWIFR